MQQSRKLMKGTCVSKDGSGKDVTVSKFLEEDYQGVSDGSEETCSRGKVWEKWESKVKRRRLEEGHNG